VRGAEEEEEEEEEGIKGSVRSWRVSGVAVAIQH
jgi:hypothetical protein